MYKQIEKWIDGVLSSDIPEEIEAFCFNLNEEDGDTWSMELVGTESFDLEDEDWVCDEVTDFGSRDNPFRWKEKAKWKKVLKEVTAVIKEYLEKGKYCGVLKSRKGVGIGFVDGDLEILYSNLS